MTSFYERQRNLFEQLKDAEQQYSFCKSNKVVSATGYGTIDKQRYRKVKHEMKQFRGKESIFKRQDAKIRECLQLKTTPDYIKHPEKWQYYTLSDVTPEQMSDKTNIQTALAFIREMEEKATKTEEPELIVDETGAVFKKPTFSISKTIKQIPEEKPEKMFRSNKIIMPEYVVGVSKSKKMNNNANQNKKATKTNKESNKVELKLNHLYIDDEDDEEST